MNKNYYAVSNKASGTVLGVYYATDKTDAVKAMLNANDKNNITDPSLMAEEAEFRCESCGREGLYSPDPEGVMVVEGPLDGEWTTLCHDAQGRVVCDECAESDL